MKVQASPFRRFVVLDIETIASDQTDDHGALDALTGKIVCVGMLFDNGHEIKELTLISDDESEIVNAFWNAIQPTDVLIGHNLLEFDLMFLRQRSWVLGIKPSRTIDLRKYYTEDVIDTMQLWSNWGFRKFAKLEVLGEILGCGCKIGHGSNVAQWWAARDFSTIAAYCMEDVRLTYRVFCRLTYQPFRGVGDSASAEANKAA